MREAQGSLPSHHSTDITKKNFAAHGRLQIAEVRKRPVRVKAHLFKLCRAGAEVRTIPLAQRVVDLRRATSQVRALTLWHYGMTRSCPKPMLALRVSMVLNHTAQANPLHMSHVDQLRCPTNCVTHTSCAFCSTTRLQKRLGPRFVVSCSVTLLLLDLIGLGSPLSAMAAAFVLRGCQSSSCKQCERTPHLSSSSSQNNMHAQW